jgi:hypothetical protein
MSEALPGAEDHERSRDWPDSMPGFAVVRRAAEPTKKGMRAASSVVELSEKRAAKYSPFGRSMRNVRVPAPSVMYWREAGATVPGVAPARKMPIQSAVGRLTRS